jgi:hypothetical protein
MVGLTKTLALEGRDDGIRVNAVLPSARTRMSAGTPGGSTVELMDRFFSVTHVASFVAWLLHASTKVTGEMFSVGGNRASRVFLGEAEGITCPSGTPEEWLDREGALLSVESFAVPAATFEHLRYMTTQLGLEARAAFERAFPAFRPVDS